MMCAHLFVGLRAHTKMSYLEQISVFEGLSPLTSFSLVVVCGVWLAFFFGALCSKQSTLKVRAPTAPTTVNTALLPTPAPISSSPPLQQLYTLIAPAVRERIGLLAEDVAEESNDSTRPLCDKNGVVRSALGWYTMPRTVCTLPGAPLKPKKFNVWSFFGRRGAALTLHACELGSFSLIQVCVRAHDGAEPIVHTEKSGALGALFCRRSASVELGDTVLAPFDYESRSLKIRCISKILYLSSPAMGCLKFTRFFHCSCAHRCKRRSDDQVLITIHIDANATSRRGAIAATLLVFWPAAHQSLNVVLPWSMHEFHCSSQQLALPVSGSVQVRE